MEEDTTPSWHSNERTVGVSGPPAWHRVGLGVGALLGCRFGREFGPPRTAKHPALAAFPGYDFQMTERRTPSWHNIGWTVGVHLWEESSPMQPVSLGRSEDHDPNHQNLREWVLFDKAEFSKIVRLVESLEEPGLVTTIVV